MNLRFIIKNIAFLFFCFLLSIWTSFANITNDKFPTNSSDIWWGNVWWINVSNVNGDNTNTQASSTINNRNDYTNVLYVWWFWELLNSIPSNSDITWIEIWVERQATNTRMRDSLVQLTKDWINPVWNDLSTYSNRPNTWKYISTYWWEWNLWWTTFSASEILDPNFWVFLQYRYVRNWWATVNVSRVILKVYYTPNYNPGWTSSTMSLWFKSNEWTDTFNDGSNLNLWYDQSWNSKDATSVVAPTYLNNPNDNLNFYPLVNFDSTQYLEWTNNWWYTDSYFMVLVPNQDVNWTISWQVPFGFNCNTWILSSWTCWLPFSWLTMWAFTIAIADEVLTHAIWSSTNWRSSQIGNANYAVDKPMLLSVNSDDLTQTTNIYEKWLQVNNFSTNTYQTIADADFNIGRSSDTNNPFPYNWKIAEIINFTNSLSTFDRQKIESYLAIKYWITMSNWSFDYYDSSWNIIYNSSLNTQFNNNILAIARDETSWLRQVEAKSVNDWWVVTIRAQSQWTNIAPSFTSIDDLEFLFVSNNNLSNTWVAAPSLTWFDLLNRKWIVQETGDTWLTDFSFDVDNSFFDIPNLNSGTNYYFVYDSNNNWDLEDETPISMNNLSWSIWWVQWINLSSWNLFTIATESSSNNIPTDIILSDLSVEENLAAGSVISTISTTDLDIWDIHTYSFAIWLGDDDNNLFSISWNNLILDGSPDYEIQSLYNIRIETNDWNWGTFQKQFQINVLNQAEAISSIIDFETPWKYSVVSWVWTRAWNTVFEWALSLESGNTWIANSQACFEVQNTFQWLWTIDFKYRVSSQAGADFLRFYIDNVEQQSWSGNVWWSTYNKNDVSSWTHTYKWCYIKDWNFNTWDDKAYVDYITFYDTNPDNDLPTIDATNFVNNSILPWWNHNIIIDYSDIWTWIDISSAVLKLYKWDWISAWWPNIASTYITNNSITTWQSNYSINNLEFGRYMYDFQIRDNYWNIGSINLEFYIDEPEFFVNTWAYLSTLWATYSPDELVVSVKTIWAAFDVEIFKQNEFNDGRWNIIFDWNWTRWVWYDMSPYTWINSITDNPVIGSELRNPNSTWELREYTYVFKIWALLSEEQAAGNYQMNLWFNLILDY